VDIDVISIEAVRQVSQRYSWEELKWLVRKEKAEAVHGVLPNNKTQSHGIRLKVKVVQDGWNIMWIQKRNLRSRMERGKI
jgi:hypothetical protein